MISELVHLNGKFFRNIFKHLFCLVFNFVNFFSHHENPKHNKSYIFIQLWVSSIFSQLNLFYFKKMFLLFNLVTHVVVDHDDDDDDDGVQVAHQDINVCHNVSAGENISLTLENISSLLDKNYFIILPTDDR